MEDDQEVAAYMFRRTVPAAHLAPEDVRWMVMFSSVLFAYTPFSHIINKMGQEREWEREREIC